MLFRTAGDVLVRPQLGLLWPHRRHHLGDDLVFVRPVGLDIRLESGPLRC